MALQRAEDRVEQKEMEVGELQRRLSGMEMVTAGPRPSCADPGWGVPGSTDMAVQTLLF